MDNNINQSCCGDFSVLMSVYKNDSASIFSIAIESILNQTLKPKEIVLVRDGEVDINLQKEIDKYTKLECVSYYPLPTNIGLGKVLEFALNKSKYDIIARMDSDDISRIDRFQIQYKAILDNNVDVVGSNISEFISTIDNFVGLRVVPEYHNDIIRELKRRSPMNHVTVMMRKSAVLDSGGYQDFLYHEDYYLWIRMINKGYKFANINDSLVFVRVGKDMYKRRGGIKYYLAAKKLQKVLLENKNITKYEYIKNLMIRFIVQVILPTTIRGYIFKKMTRRNTNV